MTAIFYILSGIVLLAAIDAARRPAYQWAEADRNKTFWVTWLIFGILLSPVGIVFAIIYATSILPSMSAAAQGTAYATFVPHNPGDAIDVRSTPTVASSPVPVAEISISVGPNDGCASCGATLRREASFCPVCGRAVGAHTAGGENPQ